MSRASSISAVPAPALVLTGIVSVQFGAALAVTLLPHVGVGGSVLLRLLFAAAVLGVAVRPRLRGLDRPAWRAVVTFGVILGVMNLLFYSSLAHLPLGVAVTVEFLGPLGLAVATSRRARDVGAVVLALAGVVLISRALDTPLAELSWTGLAYAAAAGTCWAGYILASRRTGAALPGLDGMALAMVVALVVAVPFGLGSIGDWDAWSLTRGLGVAVLSSVLPYSLEMVALRRLAPGVFGILMSLEPAVAAAGGFVVLGQRLVTLQLVGMVLVTVASAAVLSTSRPTPTST